MQIVLLALFALVALFSGAHAFAVPRPMLSVSKTVAPRSVTSLNVFGGRGKKAAAAPVEENNDYWQGDWVCADCGYVFDRDIDGGGLYFEQQKKGFICPQCRYARQPSPAWRPPPHSLAPPPLWSAHRAGGTPRRWATSGA